MRLDDLGKSRKIYFFTIKNRGISGPNDFLSFANCGHMLASDSPFIMCCACLCAEVLFLERGLGKSKLTMEASERANWGAGGAASAYPSRKRVPVQCLND